MLRINIFICVVLLVFIAACNTPPPVENNHTQDSTPVVAATADTFNIPPASEVSTIVIGKGGCKVLSDTLGIRLTECTLMPGDSAKLHDHPDHSVYVVQGGKLSVWINGSATPFEMDMKAGDALINGPLSDVAKNTGKTTIRLINVDVYRPRAK